MTAYVLRFLWNLRTHCRNRTQEETDVKPKNGPLSPQELQCSENNWIKETQKTLKDRLRKGDLKELLHILILMILYE